MEREPLAVLVHLQPYRGSGPDAGVCPANRTVCPAFTVVGLALTEIEAGRGGGVVAAGAGPAPAQSSAADTADAAIARGCTYIAASIREKYDPSEPGSCGALRAVTTPVLRPGRAGRRR